MTRSDKGSKRPGYDASRRKMIARLQRALDGVEWLKAREGQELIGRAGGQPGTPRRERRARARRGKLPADRRCPKCGEVKTKSRQWAVDQHDLFPVVCVSCLRALRKGAAQ